MARQEFKVVEERPAHGQEPDEMLREERVARFVALGQAL